MADEPVEQQHDTDADDDDVEARETDSIGNMAPWTPTPTALGRAFLQAHPDAALNINFPKIYAEDTTQRIRDLQAAYAEGSLTHRRMSELVASELGIESYEYDVERRRVEQERGAGITPQLGAGDGLAPRLPDDGDEVPIEGKRDDLSDSAVHKFKAQQRQSESAAPSLLFRQIERDEHGTPLRVIDAYSGDTGIRTSRVVRDPSGRIVGLEPEHAEQEDDVAREPEEE